MAEQVAQSRLHHKNKEFLNMNKEAKLGLHVSSFSLQSLTKIVDVSACISPNLSSVAPSPCAARSISA
jgi:hypothetical protein